MFPTGWWESLLWCSDGYPYNNSSITLESSTEKAVKQASSAISSRRMYISIVEPSNVIYLFHSNLGHPGNCKLISKMSSFTINNLALAQKSHVLCTRLSRPNVWKNLTWFNFIGSSQAGYIVSNNVYHILYSWVVIS